jgi:hypothetical protein
MCTDVMIIGNYVIYVDFIIQIMILIKFSLGELDLHRS